MWSWQERCWFMITPPKYSNLVTFSNWSLLDTRAVSLNWLGLLRPPMTINFDVCHFPFSKIEETVDFLVPGSTCFIARHISQESPLKKIFKKRLKEFQKHLRERGYPQNLLNLTLSLSLFLSLSLSEIHFENKKKALQQESLRGKNILPFVTQNQQSVPSLKSIFMKHWQLIENQFLLRQIYKEPPIISHKREKSLKDILVL